MLRYCKQLVTVRKGYPVPVRYASIKSTKPDSLNTMKQ